MKSGPTIRFSFRTPTSPIPGIGKLGVIGMILGVIKHLQTGHLMRNPHLHGLKSLSPIDHAHSILFPNMGVANRLKSVHALQHICCPF